jgi:hypothetical protein
MSPEPVVGPSMGFFNPLRQLADRVNVFRVTRSLLPKGIQDSIILPLEVFIHPHSKPPENSSNADPQAEPA